MEKGRLEAFSDGVIAIIITIMVLELKIPANADIKSLVPLIPVFFSYVISFVYVGIYWNNHHHMMQVVETINGGILWANLHLLFWLSLVPFVSAWMGENHFAQWPVACYGFVLIMNATAYTILATRLMKLQGKNSLLTQAFGNDRKGKISMVIYAIGIAFSWVNSTVSFTFYVIVACIWFIPDRRIEKKIIKEED